MLNQRLLTFLNQWQVAHLIGDSSGIGAGLMSWFESDDVGEQRGDFYNMRCAMIHPRQIASIRVSWPPQNSRVNGLTPEGQGPVSASDPLVNLRPL